MRTPSRPHARRNVWVVPGLALALAAAVTGCTPGATGDTEPSAKALPIVEGGVLQNALAATRRETRAHLATTLAGSCPALPKGPPSSTLDKGLYNPSTGDRVQFLWAPCFSGFAGLPDDELLPPEEWESRTVGPLEYSPPAGGQTLPAGKTWVSRPEDSELGDEFSTLDMIFEATERHLARVEETTLRGTPVVHYRADIPGAEVPTDGKPWAESEEAKEMDGYRVEVWLDAEQRIRQLRTSAIARGSLSKPVAERVVQTMSTSELFDYGTAPEVLAPPADQVQAEA